MVMHKAPYDSEDTLTPMISDRMAFYNQLNRLSKGKATGPDGVTNEVISGAPHHFKQLLHMFIRCLWHKQYTPGSWAKATLICYTRQGMCAAWETTGP